MTEKHQYTPMLKGVRVLDFTQYLAGPTATRLMAEMGADIIKVERETGGDPTRKNPYIEDGRAFLGLPHNQ